MTHGTTFALDEATALRLKRLASRWNVSQAEVVRRAVAQSDQSADAPKPARETHENSRNKERLGYFIEIQKNFLEPTSKTAPVTINPLQPDR